MKKSWIHCLQNEKVSFDQLLCARTGFEDKVTKNVKITLPLKKNIYRILFVTVLMIISLRKLKKINISS